MAKDKRAGLTIVIVFHDMAREAQRSLATLGAAYQRGVDAADYDVVAVDNASPEPLGEAMVAGFGKNIRLLRLDHAGVSPAPAVNAGVAAANTEHVAVINDGARMVSPGIVAHTRAAFRAVKSALVGAQAFHIGEDYASRFSPEFDRAAEDRLLESFDWRGNGYQLFDHAFQTPEPRMGFLAGIPSELTYVALRREAFEELGGFDEAFASRGGGLVNHDFLKRAVESKRFRAVMLLGEATFHQFHGGITSTQGGQKNVPGFREEYERIRGAAYRGYRQPRVTYFGWMPKQAARFVKPPQAD